MSKIKRLPVVICDLDGTLAIMEKRGPFDWHRVGEDKLNQAVFDVISGLRNDLGYLVFVLSGRDAVCKKETISWLDKNLVCYDKLLMRDADDNRKDVVVKRELFDQIKDKYDIRMVIDDRPSVCRMWRELGLFVLQVGDPHKEF